MRCALGVGMRSKAHPLLCCAGLALTLGCGGQTGPLEEEAPAAEQALDLSVPTLLVSADFAPTSSTKQIVQSELAANPNAKLLAVGDLSYASPYAQNYPWNVASWISKTYPVMGNHEFNSVAGKGGEEPYNLFNGKNAAANHVFPALTGSNGVKTYDFFYTTELSPSWLLVVVNTSNNFSTQSAASQAARMTDAVNAFRTKHGGHGCVALAMHTARFSDSFSGDADNGATWANGAAPIFNAAVADKVDVLLQGHVHDYEELVQLDANGHTSSSGVKVFTVGMGGRGQVKGGWSNVAASQVIAKKAGTINGVLKLALRPGGFGYQYENKATSGQPATSINCHVP